MTPRDSHAQSVKLVLTCYVLFKNFLIILVFLLLQEFSIIVCLLLQEFPYRPNNILECEFFLLENMDCCLVSKINQFCMFILLLTYWFARKNVDDTVIFVTIFITGTNQVHSITDIIWKCILRARQADRRAI